MSQAEPNYREYKYLCENVKSTLVALEGLCQAKNDAETAQKLFLQRHSAASPSELPGTVLRVRFANDGMRTGEGQLGGIGMGVAQNVRPPNNALHPSTPITSTVFPPSPAARIASAPSSFSVPLNVLQTRAGWAPTCDGLALQRIISN